MDRRQFISTVSAASAATAASTTLFDEAAHAEPSAAPAAPQPEQVSAFVNPRGQNHHNPALLSPLNAGPC